MQKFGFVGLAVSVATLAACSTSGLKLSTKPKASQKFSAELLLSMDRSPQETKKAWLFLSDKPVSGKNDQKLSYLEKLDQPVAEAYRNEVEAKGAKIRVTSRWLNAISVEASPEVLSEIGDLPFVSRVEQVKGTKNVEPPVTRKSRDSAPAAEFPAAGSPDADYGSSFNQAAQLHIPELHRMGLSGRGVTIALLDVGFRKDHEAFQRTRLLSERDFVMGDDNVTRDPSNGGDYDDRHGTMVWGVIAGFKPGELIGPAFGSSYLLAKTEDDRSETRKEEDFWVAGLEWSKSSGARIVSSSLGYIGFDDGTSHPYSTLDGQTIVTSRAANIAAEFGILVVNAIGNDGEAPDGRIRLGSLAAPADAFGALAVGAVDASGMIAPFSSRGPTADGRVKPDLVAQGVEVWTATNDGTATYDCGDGTSFAAPLIAGLAALLWEAHPEWSLQTLKEALRSTATKADRPSNHYGYGMARGLDALDYQPAEPALAMALAR
jgi:serine protease AprX